MVQIVWKTFFLKYQLVHIHWILLITIEPPKEIAFW